MTATGRQILQTGTEQVERMVGYVAADLRHHHNKSCFLVSLGPMTTFLFFQDFFTCFKMGALSLTRGETLLPLVTSLYWK
jgi:hypothetical protein